MCVVLCCVVCQLNKLDQCISDCTRAIELDEGYIKAYLRRAKCYTDTEEYEQAVLEYEKVYKLEKTKEHAQLVKEAKLELKKSKRKDYYKILGVAKTANEDEIKKAYRKSALMHHPGKPATTTTTTSNFAFFSFLQLACVRSIRSRSLSECDRRGEEGRGEEVQRGGRSVRCAQRCQEASTLRQRPGH